MEIQQASGGELTQDEITAFVTELPGAVVVVASEANGAPEVAWGDSFFFYDPDGDPANRRLPFATIVTKDYPGIDTASKLDRPGVFRLNVGVGRRVFEELLGYPPREPAAGIDAAAIDTVIPNPVYAAQGWVSIVNPGERTAALARELLTDAHARAVRSHRRRRTRARR